jgi:calcineurin-like phosphoesterase family protein
MAKKCDTPRKVTLRGDHYDVWVCEHGHVHITFCEDGVSVMIETSIEAYDLGNAILRGYDEIEGIPPASRRA